MWFAEHRFLGDTLSVSDGSKSGDHKVFTQPTIPALDNGLTVTYGEINGFAGDYFGLATPISSEKSLDDRKLKFQTWFNLLGRSKTGKDKAEAIRTELKTLNDLADQVLRAPNSTGEDLATVYKKNTFNSSKLDKITRDPRWNEGASFLDLAVANIDHFGKEARLTYDAGHSLALDWAVKGDLPKALAINAFADHFLEDSFAAGHMRVPRAEIAEVAKHTEVNIPKFSNVINLSSNVMHEEDGERGLWVESPSGEKWKAFGDGRLPGKDVTGKATSTNLEQCRKALRQSITEVNDAYSSKQIIQPSQFAAWHHAPIIERISQNADNQKPLLKIENAKLFHRSQKTGKYIELNDFMSWFGFYMENWSRLEDQFRAWVMNALNLPIN